MLYFNVFDISISLVLLCKIVVKVYFDVWGLKVVFPHVANLTTCQLERLYASGRPEQFQPECTLDGGYKPVQCERGICWCVDQYGNELYGTKTYGTPQSSCPSRSTPGIYTCYPILLVLYGVYSDLQETYTAEPR